MPCSPAAPSERLLARLPRVRSHGRCVRLTRGAAVRLIVPSAMAGEHRVFDRRRHPPGAGRVGRAPGRLRRVAARQELDDAGCAGEVPRVPQAARGGSVRPSSPCPGATGGGTGGGQPGARTCWRGASGRSRNILLRLVAVSRIRSPTPRTCPPPRARKARPHPTKTATRMARRSWARVTTQIIFDTEILERQGGARLSAARRTG
jgi:hypothetical protein